MGQTQRTSKIQDEISTFHAFNTGTGCTRRAITTSWCLSSPHVPLEVQLKRARVQRFVQLGNGLKVDRAVTLGLVVVELQPAGEVVALGIEPVWRGWLGIVVGQAQWVIVESLGMKLCLGSVLKFQQDDTASAG